MNSEGLKKKLAALQERHARIDAEIERAMKPSSMPRSGPGRKVPRSLEV